MATIILSQALNVYFYGLLNLIDTFPAIIIAMKYVEDKDETITTDPAFGMKSSTAHNGIELMDIDVNKATVCGLNRCFVHEVLSRQKSYLNDLLVSYLQFITSLRSECIDYGFC
ncbi:unnamed protein product [Rotaria sp. Silwood2]|nr:unnamed protein product [Rotaria sp. Silwood2]